MNPSLTNLEWSMIHMQKVCFFTEKLKFLHRKAHSVQISQICKTMFIDLESATFWLTCQRTGFWDNYPILFNCTIFLRLKKKLEIFFPLWLGTVHGCIAPKFDTCSIFRFLAKPLITQKTRFSKNFRISENMTHPKVSEVIQYPLLHTIIGPNTFSVVKATLQLQMSVCPSVSLSVSLKSKPLSL